MKILMYIFLVTTGLQGLIVWSNGLKVQSLVIQVEDEHNKLGFSEASAGTTFLSESSNVLSSFDGALEDTSSSVLQKLKIHNIRNPRHAAFPPGPPPGFPPGPPPGFPPGPPPGFPAGPPPGFPAGPPPGFPAGPPPGFSAPTGFTPPPGFPTPGGNNTG